MFLLGFFWRRTTPAAALFAAIGGLLLSIVLKFLPAIMDLSFLAPIGFAAANGAGVHEIPFLDRMFIVFWGVVIGMVLISLIAPRSSPHPIILDTRMFKVEPSFLIGSALICIALAVIYASWW